MRLGVIVPMGIVAVAAAGLVIVSRQVPGRRLEIGGLYSVQKEEQGYAVAKVLVLDEAVHVRVYKERFSERLSRVDEAKLTLGSAYDREGFGFGHIPLSREAFAAWKPVFVQSSSVRAEELDGYQEWKKHGGGVWR